MKHILFISCFFLACSSARTTGQPVKPRVFVLDVESLEKNRARIKSGDAQIKEAYKRLLKDAEAALKFGPVSVMEKKHTPPSGDKHDYMSLAPYHWPDPSKPDGLPYIRKDGETNPEVKEYKDKEYMPKLCSEVYTLALAWYFSGERMYADHAARLIQVWFLDTATRMNPNLNFGQAIKGVVTGRGAGLIDTRHFIKLIDAIGLIGNSPSWTKEKQEGMKTWFSSFLKWMEESKNGKDEMNAQNNHGAFYDAQRLSMALFTGDNEHAAQIIESAKKRIDVQMNDEGFFPKELERTISLHYSTFVMEAFFMIANMAGKTGIDLWEWKSPSGKSLRKGFDAIYPYWTKEKEWTGQQIKPFDFEETYPLLMDAAVKFRCRKCVNEVRVMAGDKADRLRIQLLY